MGAHPFFTDAQPRTTVQSCLSLVDTSEAGQADAVSTLQALTQTWAQGKFHALKDLLQPADAYLVQEGDVRLQAGLTSPLSWAFGCQHGDQSKPDWTWRTQAGLRRSPTALTFALRNSWSGKLAEGIPQPSVPRILRLAVAELGFRDLGGYRVTGTPTLLDTLAAFDEFVGNVVSLDRVLPLVLVSEVPSSSSRTPAYAVEADKLATQLAGIAHVVCLPAEGFREFRLAFGEPLAVYNGAIRIFEPGFAYSDEAEQHTLFIPARAAVDQLRGPQSFLALRITSHVLARNAGSKSLGDQVDRVFGAQATDP